MVGASPNWNRPSYFVMKYLQAKGFRVIPVNPTAVGQEILGETVYGSLGDISGPFEMVDIFRSSEPAGPITEDAVAAGAKGAWLPTGGSKDAAGGRDAGGGGRGGRRAREGQEG